MPRPDGIGAPRLDDAAAFTALGQDLAIEAAGHSAVADFVPDLLANGTDTVVDLQALRSEAVLFTGSARKAAAL